MIVDSNELIVKNFPILILDDRFFFTYSKEIKFEKKK